MAQGNSQASEASENELACQILSEESNSELLLTLSCLADQNLCGELTLPFKLIGENRSQENVHILKMLSLKTSIEQLKDNWPLKKLHCKTKERFSFNYERMLCSLVIAASPWITEFSVDLVVSSESFLGNCSGLFNFKNLRKFKVIFKSVWNTSVIYQDHIKVFRQVLESSPELQTLEIEDDCCVYHGGKILPLLKALRRASERIRTIGSLKINTVFDNSHLLEVSRMGLKLKHLSLEFRTDDDNIAHEQEILIKDVLCSFANSLDSLELHFRRLEKSAQITLEFPLMRKLTKLEFKTLLPHVTIFCNNISYMENFPALQHLATYPGRNGFEFLLQQPCSTLKTFEFGHWLDTERLIEAPNLFPNVKSVVAPMSRVHKVCQYWLGLNQLTLYFDWHQRNSNLELTGLQNNQEWYSQLQRRYSNGDSFEDIRRDYLARARESTLTELRELTVLRIYTEMQGEVISPLTFRLILLQINSLRCLEICDNLTAKQKIPAELLSEMRQKFRVVFKKVHESFGRRLN